MKGQMKVKKLNDTGLYISEMDWDNTYICKENPIGNFVMVIEPLSGFDGGIIYFDKKTDGYLIEDEGYILAGRQNKIRKRVWKWEKEYVQKRLPVVEYQQGASYLLLFILCCCWNRNAGRNITVCMFYINKQSIIHMICRK